MEVAKEKDEKREEEEKDDEEIMKTFHKKFLLVSAFASFVLLLFDLYINWLKGYQPYLFGVIPINFNYVGYHAFPYFFILFLPWFSLIVFLPRYINYWLAGMVISHLLNDLLWPFFCKDFWKCLYEEFWSNNVWMYIDLGVIKIPLTGKEMLATVIIRVALIYGLLKAKPFKVEVGD